MERPPVLESVVPVPTYRDRPATLAEDVSGVGVGGEPVEVAVLGTGRWTLLIFLSTGCQGCLPIWEALADPVRGGLVTDELAVVITRDPDQEDVEELRSLAPGEVPLVMSSTTWAAYRVQGPPFFALVDGRSIATDVEGRSGVTDGDTAGGVGVRVATEGVAWAVAQIADDVRRAKARSPG